MFWRARNELPLPEAADMDPALVYGEPLLRQLSSIAEKGAAIAVLGLAELEDGELGRLAKEALDAAGLWNKMPAWAADVGESAIVGAAVMRDPVFDDGRTVFLESRHDDGATLALGVLIDRNLGGMAKDVLLADSIGEVEQTMHDHSDEQPVELVLERIEPGVAAGLIRDAIETTDITWRPPVDEDYWNGRALALLRCDQTPNVVSAEDPREVPLPEREALSAEFLASPEGAGFAADGDEAWVASLAINFGADYAGGDPLRWSPVVVELFMADWVPRKVFTTDAFLAKLPDALDAWVRFAARKRAVPAEAVALTRAAIGEFTSEMSERSSDPDLSDPSKRLLQAAVEAGVDLQDEQALKTFVAGWNASIARDLDDDGCSDGPQPEEVILQVKVTLARVTKPPVWRRLQLPAGTSLAEVHRIVQAAFGWEDSHLHLFEVDGDVFGPADADLELDCGDERRVTLGEFIVAGDRPRYTYDFGDGWDHDILIEKVLPAESDVGYPLLVKAKGACPPEDCGGAWGYADLKAILSDPDDEQHQAVRDWLGLGDSELFDPTVVDSDLIQARLATRSPSGSA
jgi:Plasmid pRiA4b ORF-3-like protein